MEALTLMIVVSLLLGGVAYSVVQCRKVQYRKRRGAHVAQGIVYRDVDGPAVPTTTYLRARRGTRTLASHENLPETRRDQSPK